jgi:hypothetical protein
VKKRQTFVASVQRWYPKRRTKTRAAGGRPSVKTFYCLFGEKFLPPWYV